MMERLISFTQDHNMRGLARGPPPPGLAGNTIKAEDVAKYHVNHIHEHSALPAIFKTMTRNKNERY